MVTKDLGMVTAYAYAVAGGYTGTEAQFEQLMADLAIVVDDFDNFSVTVTTLPAGSSATASYSNGVLSLGIPKGDKGDTGNTGATGATPQLSIGTVETTAEPSVTITGTVDNPVLNFGLVKGDKGDTGEVSEAELEATLEDYAKIDGTYANLTAGTADQLNSNVRANDQSPYLFRTSGGSVDIGNREYINGIVGGTVAWNQLTPIITGYSAFLGTGSTSGDAFIFTADNTTVGNSQVYKSIPLPANHKYLSLVQVRPQKAVEFILTYYGTSSAHTPSVTLTANVWNTIGAVVSTSASTTQLTMYPNRNAVLEVGDTVEIKNFMLIDLTLLFGSTIADYIYSLEQATAGAGVAWFKKLFPKPYYAYDAGSLQSVSGLVSHDMTGFNQWDEEWEVGRIDTSTGQNLNATGVRSKNYIPVVPSTTYYVKAPRNVYVIEYDADKNYIRYASYYQNQVYTTSANAHYIRFYNVDVTTYNHDICINLSWDGSRNGEYEPYVKHSYALDSDLTLRGIPKLDASNNLYYDGDTYESDGTVTKKYGIVDLGSLTWYNSGTSTADTSTCYFAILSGMATDTSNEGMVSDKFVLASNKYISTMTNGTMIRGSGNIYVASTSSTITGYLVYPLATPTTETADPYTSPQIVDDFGTEEFVLASGTFPVPVGHNTDYPINVLAKVEMMPNSPSQGNGDYIVRQTSGENEYISLSSSTVIQNIISRLEALEN